MKYIPADKLIAEIERLTNQKKEKLKRFSDEDYTCSVASSINCKLCGNEEVLSIITSLQQEQPEADLEKEIARENEKWTCYEDIGFGALYDARPFDGRDIERIARHFYELGRSKKEE